MKLIVGLGNPGQQYNNTRHNIGFSYIDYFCNKYGIEFNEAKFNGIYKTTKINGIDTIIAKPMTYMNLSGDFVSKIINYYKIDIKDILIIHDDLDLNVGVFRLKQKGSSGGQNGVKHIIQLLKTEEFKRVKIGISRPKTPISISDYVLSKFTTEEQNKVFNLFTKIDDVIAEFLTDNFLLAMNRFN